MVPTAIKLPFWNGNPIFLTHLRSQESKKRGDLVRREDPVPPPGRRTIGHECVIQCQAVLWWLRPEVCYAYKLLQEFSARYIYYYIYVPFLASSLHPRGAKSSGPVPGAVCWGRLWGSPEPLPCLEPSCGGGGQWGGGPFPGCRSINTFFFFSLSLTDLNCQAIITYYITWELSLGSFFRR